MSSWSLLTSPVFLAESNVLENVLIPVFSTLMDSYSSEGTLIGFRYALCTLVHPTYFLTGEMI